MGIKSLQGVGNIIFMSDQTKMYGEFEILDDTQNVMYNCVDVTNQSVVIVFYNITLYI